MTEPDFGALMQQAAQLQQQLEAAQAEIAATSVVGEAGNGLVEVTMTGGGDVTDIRIDPSVVDASDIETLQDLIVAAIKDANTSVRAFAEKKLAPLQQGLGGFGL